MSEACPLGLNYGHFGEPSYDSEHHEWHFPRQPGRTRELRLIGQPVRALSSPLVAPTVHVQSATERAQNIKDLTHQYPELLPASSLLPGLAQVSEVINNVTSSHDPTKSDLLAIGEAVDVDKKGRGLKTVAVAAVAGGAAGEAVRLVLLNNIKLGWEDSKNIRLSAFSSKGGEEGWWYGNRSPIQQLVFAEAEGRTSSWLAVRYHGAIFVLRPELRRNANLPPLVSAASNRNCPSRLNANCVVTLPVDQANGVPYSDVAFNPWYNQQIATIDQKGFWAVWDVEKTEKQAKAKRFWTIKQTRHGQPLDGLLEGEKFSYSVADGWGVVLWAGDHSTIIVANRRLLAVYDITGNPRRLLAPNLVSTTDSEWILDVRRSSKDLTHIVVTTTFSIFWLQVTSSAGSQDGEEPAAGAKCLLSWRHFRDPEDISLSLVIADESEKGNSPEGRTTTLVLLYSRLTGLTTVFTFHYAGSYSELAPSASDPYLLPLPNEDPDKYASNANPHASHRSSKLSAMVLKLVNFQSPQGSISSGLGHIYLESEVIFYRLSLLTKDFALLEYLCAEVPNESRLELHPPNKISRLGIAKTPAKVVDDFIVSSGYDDGGCEDSPHNPTPEEEPDTQSRASLAVRHEDPCTISFQWLENEIHDRLFNTSSITDFDDSLNLVQESIEVKLASAVPTIETLLHILNASVSILDLDKASGDFVDFLDDLRRLSLEQENGNDQDEGRQLMISSILTPKLQADLGFRDTTEPSSIYENLIQTWIVPMSRQVPGRVRITLEKSLRDMAGQICLATYALRIDMGNECNEQEDQVENKEVGAQFVLPVRRRTSATSLGKGKERSDSVPSPPLASSQMSEDTGFMTSSALAALPTPELTPSLRSRSSVSSLASSEDPASQRLRAYASLTPQPALPENMSNLLGQWQIGVDPAKYNWKAFDQAIVTKDKSEDQLRQKQHQRAKKRHKGQGETTIRPSFRPTPDRLGGSQPQQGHDIQSMQGSSQQTERPVTMSQIEPGKFGGRHPKIKKLKDKGRPAGFK